MARHSPPRTTPIELNLAPMVDVFMCLIIFFMLASHLVRREDSRLIDLPTAVSAQRAEKKQLGTRVVVNIRPASDGVSYEIGGKELTPSQVSSRLIREATRDPGVRCVIRADRGVPFGHVEAVLAACTQAGIDRFVFSATPAQTEQP